MVNGYSRYAWVVFLRNKSEGFINFKDIGLRIQNEKGCPIERIWSDMEREFFNSYFLEFCHSLGIKHEFSAPKTPQQKVVVERKNRVLQEMARKILNQHELPPYIWVQAINTTCFTSNRIHLRLHARKTC